MNPGESRVVSVNINAEDLFFHDFNLNRVLPVGKYLVRAGGSSKQLSEPLELKTLPRMTSGQPILGNQINSPTKNMPNMGTGQLEQSNKPNILFITIDDLRPELGSYGAQVITPTLDRFANGAVQFNRAYCQQ